MNNHFIKFMALVASSATFVSGCGDISSFQTPSTSSTVANAGTISQTNFSLLTADVAPAVIDGTTGVFTKTDVDLTVYIGDRNNQTLTDSHTINFVAEYGLVEPSCVTVDGTCSVTWSAIKRPDPGGPGSDGFVSITAYTIGEEGFTDANGNNVFDDGDGTDFDDIEEPFVDADKVHGIDSNGFTPGDVIIDVVSTNDPTGANGIHDAPDGFFNGSGCTHSSLCGIAQTVSIFDGVTMSLVSSAIESRTIGGTVAGLAGSGLVLQNNDGDDLSITANVPYTFVTPVDDGSTYAVTVLTQPTVPTQTCTIANASGTVSANVTNVDVTCDTNTFTIGGTVSFVSAGQTLVILNNGGDALTLTNADTTFVFATPIADGSSYNVTEFTAPAAGSCTFVNETGTVSGANVINVGITCP